MSDTNLEDLLVNPAELEESGEHPLHEQDEAVLLSHHQAQDDFHEVQQLITGVDNLSVLGDNCADVLTTISTITAATESDISLLKSTLALGFGNESLNEIMPTLTVGSDLTASVETFGSVILSIYEAIAKMVKAIWEAGVHYYHRIFGEVSLLRRKAEYLRAKASNLTGKTPKTGKVTITTDALMVKNANPKNTAEVEKTLLVVQAYDSVFLGGYSDRLVKAGSELGTAMGAFNAAEMAKSFEALVKGTAAIHFDDVQSDKSYGFEHSSVVGDPRFHADNWYRSYPLPGNTAVFYHNTIKKINFGHDDDYTASKHIQEAEFKMAAWEHPPRRQHGKFDFPTMTTSDIGRMVDLILQICDRLDKYRVETTPKLLAACHKVDEGARRVADHYADQHSPDKATVERLRHVMNYSRVFTKWATGIQTSIVNMSVRTVNGVLMLMRNSIRDYA